MNLGPSSPERCLALLEALAGAGDGLALSALAEAIGSPKSAAHRLLQALVAAGFARQDPGTQRYLATLRLATLGFRLLEARGEADIAQPVLARLAEATGGLARLAVVEGETIAWVAKAQGARQSLRYEPVMGRHVRLHATATGKAWLATLPVDDAVRIVLRQGFDVQPVGPRAIRGLEALLPELERTRARGHATVDEEGEPGVAAIAAAIRDGGRVVGVVSAAAPRLLFTQEHLAAIAPAVTGAAAELAELWPVRRRQEQLAAAERGAAA